MSRFLGLALMLLLAALPATAAERASPFLTGQLLVASPDLPDPRFAESVVLVINHDADGAIGLIVNKAIGEGDLGKLLRGFGREPGDKPARVRLHYGGPVEPQAVFVLHSDDYESADGRTVADGIRLTTRPEVLQAVTRGDGPADYLVAFGYAGWAPGQLESEFARGDWSTAPADPALLFEVPPEARWQRAREGAGLRL